MDATDITRSTEDSYSRCIDIDIGVEVEIIQQAAILPDVEGILE